MFVQCTKEKRLITESLIGQLMGPLVRPLIGPLVVYAIEQLIGPLEFGTKFRTRFGLKGELGGRRPFYGSRSTFMVHLLVTGFGHTLLLQVLVTHNYEHNLYKEGFTYWH